MIIIVVQSNNTWRCIQMLNREQGENPWLSQQPWSWRNGEYHCNRV